ncbi:MAG: type II secretion system F family protein [Candidatus Omnitrophica bacterium]|nr:type II secretion system F family protein [Candidatus Omnitrophota bacterium]
MATYRYKVRDASGVERNDQIEGSNEFSIAAELRRRGYTIISLEKRTDSQSRKNFFPFKKVSQQDIVLMTRQISRMIKSGLPLTAVLSSIVKQSDNPLLMETMKTVLKDVEGGSTFSEALRKHPKRFNQLYCSMVQVGETGGIINQSLDRLVILNSKDLEMRMALRSAMIYPSILITVSIAVLTGIVIYIIPKFIGIFEAHEIELPLATQILLFISSVMQHYWFVIIAVITGGVFYGKSYLQGKGKYSFHKMLISVPIWGKFYVKVIIARFSRVLGALVKSGVPFLQALTVTENVLGNVYFCEVVRDIRASVSSGQSLTEPMQTSRLFPAMVIQMISAGEKSGHLDSMLVDIAEFYEQEIDYFLKNITTILEPLMLIIMGGIVMFIALAVLLPIFNLVKVFRSGM